MNFLKSLYQSLYDFKWLNSQRETSVSKALVFFSFVVLLVTTSLTAPIVFFALPKLVDQGTDTFVTKVPDFKAILENGQLNIEKLPQPFIFEDDSSLDGKVKLYIDTVSTSTPVMKDLIGEEKMMGALLITKTGFEFYDGGELKTESQSFAAADTEKTKMEFSKTDLQTIILKIQKAFLPWIAGVIFLLALIAIWVGKFIAVLFWALVVMWLAHSMGRNWKYGEVLKVVLYATALPTVLGAVLSLVGFTVPLLHTVVLTMMVYMTIKSDETAAPAIDVPASPTEPPQA